MRLRRLVVVGLLLGLLGVLLPVSPVGGQVSGRLVSGVSVSGDGEGVAVVSWTAPVEAPVDYRVMWARADLEFLSYRYEDEAERGNAYPAGSAVSVRLEGLTPGAQYKAVVRARYGPGRQGPWSDHASGPAGQTDDSTDDEYSENDDSTDDDSENDGGDDNSENDGGDDDSENDGDSSGDGQDGGDGDGGDGGGGSGVVDGGIIHGDGDGFDLVGVMGVASAWVGDQEVLGYSLRGGGVGSFATTAVGDEQYAGHVGGRGFLNGLMRVPGRYDISRVGEYDDALVLMTQFGLAAPFLLEVGGRLYSSASASAANVRGYSDKFWVWEDPCARWAEGQEVAVSFDDGAESAAALRSADASLASLELADAELGQEFSAAVLDYSATAGDGVSRTTVNAAAADPNACSVEISPADADPDTAGHQIDVDTEDGATVAVSVTAGDGSTAAVYTVIVSAPGGALPAAAAGMGLDGIPGLGFDPDQRRYDKVVPPATTSTTVRVRTAPGTTVDTTAYRPPPAPAPVAPRAPKSSLVRSSQPPASTSGSGSTNNGGGSTNNGGGSTNNGGGSSNSGGGPRQGEVGSGGRVDLPPGQDTLVVVKTSTEDNERQRIYTARLRPAGAGNAARTRSLLAPSQTATDPRLSALAVTPGTLSPAFAATTFGYEVAVAHNVEQVTVTATAAAGAAAVVAAPDADSGADGHQVALNPSSPQQSAQTAFVVVVSAGTAIDSYTVVVTRAAAPSNDAALSALSLSSGTLAPAFSADATQYSASVAATVTQLTVTATKKESGGSVAITPADAGTASGHQVDLATGVTDIAVTVTAADNTTTRTYQIAVARPSSDASLSALALTADGPNPTLSPAFAAATTAYTALASPTARHVTVTATPADTGAAVAVSPPDADPDTTGHQIDLDASPTTPALIAVTVTSPGGAARRTYTINAYRHPASIAGLTLSDGTLTPRLDAETTRYNATVTADTAQITITATPALPGATATIEPPDADTVKTGHQINLTKGRNTTITTTITAADNTTTRTYHITIARASDQPFGWNPLKDYDVSDVPGLEEGRGSAGPTGVWSDGETMWVSYRHCEFSRWNGWQTARQYGDGGCFTWTDYLTRYPSLRAFDVATGARKPSRDIDIGTALLGTEIVSAIWSDGSTMWVLEYYQQRNIYAFDLATGRHQPDKTLGNFVEVRDNRTVPKCNCRPTGLWSDGETMFVSDLDDAVAYAWDIESRTPKVDRWIGCQDAACRKRGKLWTPSPQSSLTRNHQMGLWSDGATVWISIDGPYGGNDDRVVAFDRATGDRLPELNFDTPKHVGNNAPRDIWSDGETLWVTDWRDRKVYAYNMPRRTYLSSLEVTGADIELSRKQSVYVAAVDDGATSTTVSATAADPRATVAILPADADSNTDGHQVALGTGTTTISVTVTNDGTSRVYTASLVKAVGDVPLGELFLLNSLTVGDVDMTGFKPAVREYSRLVAADVSSVTVAGSAPATDAVIAISPADADSVAAGHQVALDADGETEITVTVSHSVAEFSRYTVTLVRLDGSTSPLSGDATLSGLSLSGVDLGTFSATTLEYLYPDTFYDRRDRPVSDLVATPAHSGATWTASPPDADPVAAGHQFTRGGGAAIEIVVTSQDALHQRRYVIRRAPATSDSLTGCTLCQQGALATTYGGLAYADGKYITIHGTTVRVFDAATGDKTDEFTLSRWSDNLGHVRTFWSDGDDLWVIFEKTPYYRSRPHRYYIYRYRLASRGRTSSSYVQMHSTQSYRSPHIAMWGDGKSLYVLDKFGKLRAYSNKTRTLASTVTLEGSSWSPSSRSMWSDGSILWVADCSSIKAYNLSDGSRQSGLDIATTRCGGLWGDGATLWSAHGGKLVGHTLGEHARLSHLKVDGYSEPFHSGVFEYSHKVGRLRTMTIEARAAFTGGSSSIAFSAPDVNPRQAGHQVALAPGQDTTVTITVTAPNGTDTETYTVHLRRP